MDHAMQCMPFSFFFILVHVCNEPHAHQGCQSCPLCKHLTLYSQYVVWANFTVYASQPFDCILSCRLPRMSEDV
jgi:hypothetical protein